MTIQHIYKNIYIGDVDSLQYSEQRMAANIQAVINCTIELKMPRFIPQEVQHYLELDLEDGKYISPNKISAAIKFAEIAYKEGLNVLVACTAGLSRSPSIILAIMVNDGWKLDEALNWIKSKRPAVNPCHECLDSIKEYFGIDTYDRN